MMHDTQNYGRYTFFAKSLPRYYIIHLLECDYSLLYYMRIFQSLGFGKMIYAIVYIKIMNNYNLAV